MIIDKAKKSQSEMAEWDKGYIVGYEKGRADAIDEFIETLNEIYDYVWDRDIPSPSVPEYKEHHEDCVEIMAKVKDKIRILMAQREQLKEQK